MSKYNDCTSKTARIAYIREMVRTDAAWALKGLVRIYENQTEDEKSYESTRHDNGIGFTGADGHIMTSIAKQYIARGSLSPKQMFLVHKNMQKYARQLENAAS